MYMHLCIYTISVTPRSADERYETWHLWVLEISVSSGEPAASCVETGIPAPKNSTVTAVGHQSTSKPRAPSPREGDNEEPVQEIFSGRKFSPRLPGTEQMRAARWLRGSTADSKVFEVRHSFTTESLKIKLSLNPKRKNYDIKGAPKINRELRWWYVDLTLSRTMFLVESRHAWSIAWHKDPMDQVTTESKMNIRTANMRSQLHADDKLQHSQAQRRAGAELGQQWPGRRRQIQLSQHRKARGGLWRLSLYTHTHAHTMELKTERKNNSTLKDRRNRYKTIPTLSQPLTSGEERVPNQKRKPAL